MTFVVVLIALFIQWFVNLEGRYRHTLWFTAYYTWINDKAKTVQPWGWVILWILPPVIVVTIIAGLFHHFWGIAGEFVLSLVLLWYCMDYDGCKDRAKKSGNVEGFLVFTFQHVFATIFWYAFLGVFGLSLYYMVCLVHHTLEQLHEENHVSWKAINRLRGILDWIPMRLLGITYALVGKFGATFTALAKSLFTGVQETRKQVVDWALLALEEEKTLANALALVDRGLLVWLVALALLAIGSWVG